MTLRGLRVRSSELALCHLEAAAFLDEVDAWLARTNTPWGYLCDRAGVNKSVRSSVRTVGNGMLRKSHQALIATMEAYPDGVTAESIGRAGALTDDATLRAFAQELRAWMERTETAPWRVATMMGRTTGYLINWISDPKPMRGSTVQRYRNLMAKHPEGLGRAVLAQGLKPDNEPPPPPTFDPLAERRGEAERMRKQWIAQQAAEHQRKYGRPLGRPIEEMAA